MCLHCVIHTGKALIQVELPEHALSENTKSIYMKKKSGKMANFKRLSFCQKNYFLGIKYLHANVQYLSIVYTKY